MKNKSKLRELNILNELLAKASSFAEIDTLAEIKTKEEVFPLYALRFGHAPIDAPSFTVFAGVHGLEKVGSHVALYFLRTFLSRLEWDRRLQETLNLIRINVVPIVNPGGMFLKSRCNPSGVDLMRNAPIEAEEPALRLIGGHRLSHKIPWFRGHEGAEMEVENQAICEFAEKYIFPSKIALSIDLHSGFGMVDRLWFPYAKTTKPFPRADQAIQIGELLHETYPYNVYQVEPQSVAYLTHGDVWDYLFDKHQQQHPENVYIPWTLEMGSWLWVKKNPRQLFSLLGGFNPILPHRYQRTMRRHMPLMDFFISLVLNPESWTTE